MATQALPHRSSPEVKNHSPRRTRAHPFLALTHLKTMAIAVLSIALIGTLIAKKADHDQFKSSLQMAKDIKKHDQQLEQTIVALNQQHAQDEAFNKQLTITVSQKTQEASKLTLEWTDAEHKYLGQQHDLTQLQAQFNDLRDKNDAVVLDEDHNNRLYMAWKDIGLNERDYILGLYADDLALRNAAKKDSFPPTAFSDPDALATAEAAAKPSPDSNKRTIAAHPQPSSVSLP